VLVGIVSWFSQEDLLGLIKASKELNNLIPPPKSLGIFLTVLEIEGGSFTGHSIEDSSEEINFSYIVDDLGEGVLHQVE